MILSHCILCLDWVTFIQWEILSPYFPGRTEEDMFSSSLYRFGLHGTGLWETVQPTGGKPPATAGHSMVFHSPSRTLLVYGGHRPTTARYTPFWAYWLQWYTHSQCEEREKIRTVTCVNIFSLTVCLLMREGNSSMPSCWVYLYLFGDCRCDIFVYSCMHNVNCKLFVPLD